ncbi:hypothetical protein ELX84_18735 [Escherichia coli]|nr:hypothetical protein [Escherichia coli]MBW5922410.1 hypothetical protein [Klebsiella pneumoniae]MCH7192110.1 hypothetical protein [Escherichia coli]MDJ1190600.1 hypothetical protein [Escherichia coli]MDJ1250296.1 hypothetical protein [Escherichia coli]
MGNCHPGRLLSIKKISPAKSGLFYTRNTPRFTRAHHNTEPFRMTLEDTGLAIGAFLWAGFLCDKVHH